jgi:hypothetical protein
MPEWTLSKFFAKDSENLKIWFNIELNFLQSQSGERYEK